ncbi:MAG: hypothetical protein B7Y49_07990 [Sphingomonas sp. 28-62-11]|nr:MAG: hypothetical protein B7Y49_07990 [Sphingomonas sp. 28-62-11]
MCFNPVNGWSVSMSKSYKNWLDAMCGVVVLFGFIMASGALPATEWPARLLLEWQNQGPLVIDRAARVTLGVLGGVMCGWGVTLYAAFQAAHMIGEGSARIWRLILASMIFWFVVDSSLSIATGFALNALMNVGFLLAFVVPISVSGVLRR